MLARNKNFVLQCFYYYFLVYASMRSESKAYEYLAKGSRVQLGRDDGCICPLFTTFIQDVGDLSSHLLF